MQLATFLALCAYQVLWSGIAGAHPWTTRLVCKSPGEEPANCSSRQITPNRGRVNSKLLDHAEPVTTSAGLGMACGERPNSTPRESVD